MVPVSLRGAPLEAEVTIPDVTVELYANGEHIAAVNTVLDADQTDEAHELLQEIVTGLESGDLPPTAGAIEPLADRLR